MGTLLTLLSEIQGPESPESNSSLLIKRESSVYFGLFVSELPLLNQCSMRGGSTSMWMDDNRLIGCFLARAFCLI